jgi:hypothetical protein
MAWIETHQIRILNIAGPPRKPPARFIYRCAFDYLLRVFSSE